MALARPLAANEKKSPGKKALLIGGGAPNSTLMAGALVAFIENRLSFDVISTAGAGALMGLLYQAPKGTDPVTALTDWAKVGVADPIYGMFPVNYKVFMKPGPAAAMYRQWLTSNPFTSPLFDPQSPWGSGLFSDWAKLGLASFSPSDLTPWSLGMCAHLPFVEQVIDFSAIPKLPGEFYINAYNMTRQEMRIWGKGEITPEHMQAAFAFPLIYPPYTLDGEDYIEGAAIDTLNFKALVCDDQGREGLHRDVDTMVIFDILGCDKLIRRPKNLYDAWVHSIITPLVEIAKDDIRLFEYKYNIDPQTGQAKRRLLKVDLMKYIPEEHWGDVLEWSDSNLKLLFEAGYRAGEDFCREYGALFR